MCETLPTVEEEMLFGAASLAFSAEISWCDIVRLVAFFVANGLISSNSWLMLVEWRDVEVPYQWSKHMEQT